MRQKNIVNNDYIIVTHKAGKKGTQQVLKFRDQCPVCKKDKGYRFKSALGKPCNKCACTQSYKKNRKINSNGGFIRSYHKTPNQGTVCARSSYEAYYIEHLNGKGVDYMYEPKWFILSDGTSYLPDLYLTESDTYIEIKGRQDSKTLYKYNKFKLDYPQIKIQLITKDDLQQIGFHPNFLNNQFKLIIQGESWTVKILSVKQFDSRFGTETEAITKVNEKCLYFKLSNIDAPTVAHELIHAYHYYMNVDSAPGLPPDDKEEILAEFLSKNLMKIMYHWLLCFKQIKRIAKRRFKININYDFEDIGLSGRQYFKLLAGLNSLSRTKNTDMQKVLKHLVQNELDK